MDSGTRKPIIKVVGPCLGYILTKFGGYNWSYVVTVPSGRVKIHPGDKFFDTFHLFHCANGIFGENQWKQSCSTVKDGPLDRILSILVKICGHDTLVKKKNTVCERIFLTQLAIFHLYHVRIDKNAGKQIYSPVKVGSGDQF